MSFKRDYFFYNGRGQRKDSDWRNAFGLGVSLKDFGDTLARYMPFDTRVSVELMGGQQSKTSLVGKGAGSTDILQVDDIYIRQTSNGEDSFIGIDEIRVDPKGRFPNIRGQGLGKMFLANCVDLCEKLNIPRIRLTAGRENGALFWARHGFNIEQMSQRSNFWDTKQNFENIRHMLSPDTCKTIEDAFQMALEDADCGRMSAANRILATVDDVVDGTAVSELIYKGVEYRAVLDLNDPDQRQAYDHSMRNIEKIRENAANISDKLILPDMNQRHIARLG